MGRKLPLAYPATHYWNATALPARCACGLASSAAAPSAPALRCDPTPLDVRMVWPCLPIIDPLLHGPDVIGVLVESRHLLQVVPQAREVIVKRLFVRLVESPLEIRIRKEPARQSVVLLCNGFGQTEDGKSDGWRDDPTW